MKRLAAIFLFISFLMSLVLPASEVKAVSVPEGLTAGEKASALLQQMTPEEKVGQLFLVSFIGTDASDTTEIYDLVKNKHIGGVILLRQNDNFSNSDTNLADTQNLISSLQSIAWGDPENTQNTEGSNSNYIPLFVAISQEGDTSPNDQILNGMTPLANEMAIGATWQTSNAENTGRILGQELSSLGFNMLLGPSLDVTDSVRIVDSEDLGVKVFGGNAYWVSEMGKAYIRGVHEGSENKIAVIAKNFPGRGNADRTAEDEVATVRKSLEQLEQVELAPFAAVTSQEIDEVEQTDGLLVPHIRYEGIQGNILADTKPISMDSTALGQLLDMSEFSGWRENGGVMVSDDLGTESIKNFYDPNDTSFDARQVAKNAFMAGNDLLYMGNLTSSGDEDNYTTIVHSLELFLKKYQEDSAFAQRVDESVLRLLTLKYELYDDFSLSEVLPSADSLSDVGNGYQTTFEIAKSAVTLISPNQSELDSVLPNPPKINDRIVFISDLVTEKQCNSCMASTLFSAEELRNAVIGLYGQNASGQIQDYQLSAYTFDDLKNYLDQTGDTDQLKDDLAAANWIVFSFLGDDETGIGDQVLRRFLSERSASISGKHIIGFAFNAPYYLDATDISKFTAYYGLYGKTSPFIEVAARVLFQEITPKGSLPVSVAGVGYDLATAVKPDADQIIQLMVDTSILPSTIEPTISSTATPVLYQTGDTLSVMTGVIVDTNGNPVPDGTVVRFMIDTGSTSGTVETVETVTEDGIARTNYRIPNTDLLEITVQADPAVLSQTLQLQITEKGGIVTAYEPTILITPTGSLEATFTAETSFPTSSQMIHAEGYPSPGDWFLSTIFIIGISALAYWVGSMKINTRWAIRFGILNSLGGYLAYLYLAIGMPGSTAYISQHGTIGITFISILGVLAGWLASAIWWLVKKYMDGNLF